MTGSRQAPKVDTAMIMAAGLGRRMHPLTERLPKPLIELHGRTLLDRGLARLEAAGVGKVVVNVHYLADLVEAHLAPRSKPEIVISDERDELLDTGGGLARALPELGPGPFFVINSDSVWHETGAPLMAQLLDAWDDDAMDCLLALAPREGCVGYGGAGDFTCDSQGRLSRREASATAPYVNTGAYLLHPRVFVSVPEGPFSMNLVWDRLIAHGRLHGVVMQGLWMHVGTPEALAEADARLIELGE